MRPLVISFKKRCRHFFTASSVLRKFVTGIPGSGSSPQSPRKPFSNIRRTDCLEGASIKNFAFICNIAGLRKLGNNVYIGGVGSPPDKFVLNVLLFLSIFLLLLSYSYSNCRILAHIYVRRGCGDGSSAFSAHLGQGWVQPSITGYRVWTAGGWKWVVGVAGLKCNSERAAYQIVLPIPSPPGVTCCISCFSLFFFFFL